MSERKTDIMVDGDGTKYKVSLVKSPTPEKNTRYYNGDYYCSITRIPIVERIPAPVKYKYRMFNSKIVSPSLINPIYLGEDFFEVLSQLDASEISALEAQLGKTIEEVL